MLILEKRPGVERRKKIWNSPKQKREILGKEKLLRSKSKLKINGKMTKLKRIAVMPRQIKKTPLIHRLPNKRRRI